jgi:hypothetical protein
VRIASGRKKSKGTEILNYRNRALLRRRLKIEAGNETLFDGIISDIQYGSTITLEAAA